MFTNSSPYNALWHDQLENGLISLGLQLTQHQCEMLQCYLALLIKWNRAFNLTAIRDPAQMVSRQLLDSLSVLPHIKGPRIIDVGTGAGLPGVPLAVAKPEWTFTLLDSNGKKTRFVNQVRNELALDNLLVVQDRVERFGDPDGYDTVTSRAFASLADMIAWTEHLVAPDGIWVAMKGPAADGEREALPANICAEEIDLHVPGVAGDRRAVVCSCSV